MTSGPGRYLRRLLLVSQYFSPEPGAPSVRYDAITRTLVELGVEVDVLTAVPNYPSGRVPAGYAAWRPAAERHAGARVLRLPVFPYGGLDRRLRLLNWASFSASAVAGALATRRPDLVMVESPPLPLVVSAALIARRHRVPLLMYAADLWPDAAVAMGALGRGTAYRALKALESFCYGLAWRITVPTEGLRDRLRAHPRAGTAKVLLLPNGVDPRVFRPLPADDPEAEAALAPLGDRILFMYAGTVGHAQALDVLIDAAAAVRDDGIGIVVIGDGPVRDDLVARSSALGLDNVLFLPAVPADRVARYLAFARATIAPLRGVPLFEATRPAKVFPSLACARPVVFCGRGEMAWLIERRAAGVVVPPEDADALARTLRELRDRPEEAAAMGARGREWALAEFDFPALVRDWYARISAELPLPARGT